MKRWLLYLMLSAALTAGGCASRGTGTDKPALPVPEQTPAVSAQASPGRAAADLVPERLSPGNTARACAQPMIKACQAEMFSRWRGRAK